MSNPTDARPRGRFVVLDGVDGCGKSTQAELLVERLEGQGESVLHLREPGGSSLGEALRGLLLSRQYDPRAEVETLLFAAARRQLLDELVAPALREGRHVVCERFHPSTFAYQAVAGGLPEDEVLGLLRTWSNRPAPDLVLVLDLPTEAALARRGAASDRIEDKGQSFLERVAGGYRRYVELGGDPATRLVSGEGTREEVGARVWQEVQGVLGD